MKTTRICSMLLLVAWAFGTCRAQDVHDVLAKAASAYTESNGIEARFTTRVRSVPQKVSESFEGTIQMKGDRFTLQTPDMRIWFDGKTQWSYMERNGEVNITTPSGAELQMTNPVLLLHTYKKDFTALYEGESTTSSAKSAYDVALVPKKKGDVLRISLQIEKNSYLPVGIVVEAKNGLSTTIGITKLRVGANQPDAFFVFKASDFPDAEVIDLR